MLEENKALVQRYYEEAMGDLSGIDEVVTSSFVDHHFPPDMPPGPAGVRKFFLEHIAGIFSDVRIEIDFLLAEGDKVDCHFVVYALHTGDGAGGAGSGTPLSYLPLAPSVLPTASWLRPGRSLTVPAWPSRWRRQGNDSVYDYLYVHAVPARDTRLDPCCCTGIRTAPPQCRPDHDGRSGLR